MYKYIQHHLAVHSGAYPFSPSGPPALARGVMQACLFLDAVHGSVWVQGLSNH